MIPIVAAVIIAVVCAVAAGVVCFFVGIAHRKKQAELAMGSAEQEAKRIISEAIKTAEAKKKEAVLEGKDEIHRLRKEREKAQEYNNYKMFYVRNT